MPYAEEGNRRARRRKESRREPTRVDLWFLYSRLNKTTSKKTGGNGVSDGVTISFSREEIVEALRHQDVHEDDVQAAIDHCLRARLLSEDEDGFHLTQGSLSNYRAMCRRV